MRGYIAKIIDRGDHPEYLFARTISEAVTWPSEYSAELRLGIFDQPGIEGIVVASPDGQRAACSNFRVERKSQSACAISCDVPFAEFWWN